MKGWKTTRKKFRLSKIFVIIIVMVFFTMSFFVPYLDVNIQCHGPGPLPLPRFSILDDVEIMGIGCGTVRNIVPTLMLALQRAT